MRFACHSYEFHPNTVVPPYGAGGVKKSRIYMENVNIRSLSLSNRFFKRCFDISMSFIGLILTGWIIILAFFFATIDTRKRGIFTQIRIGQYGKPFKVIKIRTMRDIREINTNVTTLNDPRITKLGFFFEKLKLTNFLSL